ncbi:MAG: hypothetical protein MJ081_01645 [Ruminococcus sp.]|nr:hypothetical protein [Ruminococcus sp.]
MNLLVRNTYYVMLSRPRHNLAIWFKDDVTKKHVAEIFGIALEESMATADETNIIVGNRNNKSYHKANCRFAPSNRLKRVEFWSVEEAINASYTPCQSCNP